MCVFECVCVCVSGHCGSGVDATTSVPVRLGRQTARRLPVSVLAKNRNSVSVYHGFHYFCPTNDWQITGVQENLSRATKKLSNNCS